MKNSNVVDKILKYHPKLIAYNGCDGYKCGNPDDVCKKVAVALVPTAEVLKKAGEAGCNLVITHEPIFYQTPDFPSWMGNFKNSVYEEKQKLIDEYGLTVFRDHDHMHAHNPDSIFFGVMRELGWEQYYVKPKSGAAGYFCMDLPKMKLRDVAEHLKEKLNLNGLKYMGDLDKEVSRVAIVGHLFPGFMGADEVGEDGFYHDFAMELMKAMEEDGVEVIIPGEIIEWTVLAYIRDAIEMGKNMSCLSIGHFNVEELGMKDFADRIREQIEDVEDTPEVIYIPTEDGFNYF